MAAPPRRWGKLPIDKVTEIVKRVPCAIDRARMAAACKEWHQAVKQAPRPSSRLPSLLLEPAGGRTGVYCYLSGCRDHGRFPGPRHFGSYDGAWLFLAYGQTRGHRLLNVRTGASYALPDEVQIDAGNQIHPNIVILAATLSFPPDHPKCVAAGIVTYQPGLGAPRQRGFAFWRPRDEVAISHALPPVLVGAPGLELEDVVWYHHSFHFLTQGGDVLVCNSILDDDWHIVLERSEAMRFQGDHADEKLVRACYLVESRGKLLMVVRFAPHHHEATSSFKVFQSSFKVTPIKIIDPEDDDGEEEEEEEADEDRRTWIELATLDGRMLFVGRGCSRSYDVKNYPGFKDGIFFLDDWSFYDDEMMFRGVNERQYPCRDIGRWSPEGPHSHVDLYFPERIPSYNSPPAWLVP